MTISQDFSSDKEDGDINPKKDEKFALLGKLLPGNFTILQEREKAGLNREKTGNGKVISAMARNERTAHLYTNQSKRLFAI